MTWPIHPAAEVWPILSDEKLANLAEDIAQHGQVEPLVLWMDPDGVETLLDGRNRLLACEIAGVDPRTRHVETDDPIATIVSLNEQRRHMSNDERAVVALELVPIYESEAAKRKAQATGRPRGEKAAPSDGATLHQETGEKKRAPRSSEKAAKATKTSARQVAKAKRIKEQAPDLFAKVQSGEITINRAERIIRDREAEAKRVEAAKAEAAQAPEPLTLDLREGDFREVLADLRDVDAIITDPPYPQEFLPLLGDLAEWSDLVLKPDGVLVVLLGQTHLPDAYRLLSRGRPYRWTGCYLTTGPADVSHARKCQSQWKPLLIYGRGPRFSDVVKTSGDDKSHHKWGQDFDAFRTIVERFTAKGETVVDPFSGGGTTLLAAHALGRHAIGCDVDPEAVRVARRRLDG